jgi:hypothetical protein
MAITNYKKVEDNKGYFLEDKDRQIFEKEISRGYFGFDEGDVIEFVVYDSNDNPLPQESAGGKNVRYINYNDEIEQKYFGKTQLNKENIQSNQAEEFFIDTEKLLNEAGYSQGTFKTSITLLNRRLGSEDRENDKVWIHEISPSRTEIRLLPSVEQSGNPNSDLDNRYTTFVDCGIFKADILPFIDEFISSIDVQKAIESMLTLKGSVQEGQNYIKLIESEFKLSSFETFLTNVNNKFIEAAGFYKTNRNYDIFSNNYGQPISSPTTIFSVDQVFNDIIDIIGDCIEYYLPKRDIQYQSSLSEEQQKTIDELEKVLETVSSNNTFDSTIPESISAKTYGCKDPNALNYDEFADLADNSLCVYPPPIDVVDIPDSETGDGITEDEEEIVPPPIDETEDDIEDNNQTTVITGGTGGGNSTQSETTTVNTGTGGGAGTLQTPDNTGVPQNDDTVFTQDNMDTLGKF